MGRTWAAVLLLLLTAAAAGGAAEDRRERYGELGRRLSGEETTSPVDTDAALAELFALADAEVVDNLRAGEPYASAPFIQERLDALMAVWGGAGLRVHRLGRAPEGPALTVGVFSAPGPPPVGSLRVYARRDAEPTALASSTHEGTPALHAWPPARDGATQFVVAWMGAASGPGGRPLVIEVWRRSRSGGAERIWSSTAEFPDGLSVLGFGVKDGAISVRYEARYPGWHPGCQGQTEQIDVYRPDPRRGGLALASRRVVRAWHRELQAAVSRLLAALGAGDVVTINRLVPDRAVRARLPHALAREPACDQESVRPPSSVAVAVTETRNGRLVPWSLTWRPSPAGWRLTAAAPMLE